MQARDFMGMTRSCAMDGNAFGPWAAAAPPVTPAPGLHHMLSSCSEQDRPPPQIMAVLY